MKKILLVFLINFCFINTFGQTASRNVSKPKNKIQQYSNISLSPKEQLKNAVLKSQKSQNVSIKVELTVQNKQFVSTFEYSAPNRYSLFETKSGNLFKAAIEIAGQRFQKKDEQWIKTRKDYYPLREQFELHFPIKFVSKKEDIIKIKDVKVNYLGEASLDEKKYFKYDYEISYKDFDNIESGIGWINQKNGLLERIESENCGLFGATKSLWTYYYDKEVKIEKPKEFIEKDWVD